jgi:hypothetical protein
LKAFTFGPFTLDMDTNRGKTTIRSFRVDEAALEVIEKEAKARGVSVNALVNQLLISYVNLDRYLEPLSMVKMSSDAFRDLLEAASDEEVFEAGIRTAANTIRSVILSRRGTIDLESILEHLKTMSEYAKIYRYSEASNKRKRTITLIHKWGKKGSLYYSGVLTAMLGMVGVTTKIVTADNFVSFAI